MTIGFDRYSFVDPQRGTIDAAGFEEEPVAAWWRTSPYTNVRVLARTFVLDPDVEILVLDEAGRAGACGDPPPSTPPGPSVGAGRHRPPGRPRRRRPHRHADLLPDRPDHPHPLHRRLLRDPELQPVSASHRGAGTRTVSIVRRPRRSGGEALDDPGAGVVAAVADAIVEAARAALPELDLVDPRRQPPQNGGRATALPASSRSAVSMRRLQVGAVGEDVALRRGPRPDLAVAGTRGEVGVALLGLTRPSGRGRAPGGAGRARRTRRPPCGFSVAWRLFGLS